MTTTIRDQIARDEIARDDMSIDCPELWPPLESRRPTLLYSGT